MSSAISLSLSHHTFSVSFRIAYVALQLVAAAQAEHSAEY